jgi:hypothetical protein
MIYSCNLISVHSALRQPPAITRNWIEAPVAGPWRPATGKIASCFKCQYFKWFSAIPHPLFRGWRRGYRRRHRARDVGRKIATDDLSPLFEVNRYPVAITGSPI